MPKNCTRKHNAQDIWFILACLCPSYFTWVFLSCFLHCFHMQLHPLSETSLPWIGHVLKLLPGQTKRIKTCWVLEVSRAQRFASTHRHPPSQPGSGWAAALAPGQLGREQGTAGCAHKLCRSLLAWGELRLSQLAGIYKYLWHSLHYYFSWALNIRLLIAGKKLVLL